MKKQTVYTWLLRQKDLTLKKELSERLCTIKRAAFEQCETWLFAHTWATMREPVRQQQIAIEREARPLREKEQQRTLSDEEAVHLSTLRARNEIYARFLSKITPTARQAERAHTIRQRESTGRG